MQTLVLRIPDELAADIEAEARRLNTTKSEVARARLEAARTMAPAPGAGFELISDLVGAETGGPQDISARKKHYLKSTGYGRERSRR
ncbi:MAG TPA: hypothetical protein VGM54_22870 [Chthoniobacter sp.]|jgi:hypothetical protein